MPIPTQDIDNDLIAALATRVLDLQRALSLYACHSQDCPSPDGYPCTCGLERAKL